MFADVLVAVRKSLGLTQKEFAAAIGVKEIAAWELGTSLPGYHSCELIEDYCKANGIDDSELRNTYLREMHINSCKRSTGMSWNKGFQELCEYLQEHDSYPPAPTPLGIWVTLQRKEHASYGRLSEKHIDQLNSIGFQWKADEEKEAQEWDQAIWYDHYNTLLCRFRETGHIPKDSWITQQLKATTLTPEQQELLNELGIRMVPGSIIRNARKPITQGKLAQELGVSTATLCEWEKGLVREYKARDILKTIERIKNT